MKCENCSHAEMCRWMDELEGEGCDFFDGEQEPITTTNNDEPMTIIYPTIVCDDAISRPTVVKFEGTNMACMGGDEIMKEFENNTQQRCDDKVISLERAKKQIGRWIGYIDQDMINRICISLEQLPSVTQKSGKWIIIDDCEKFIAKCSECGRIEDSRMIGKYPYCHCGARMESEDKE